MLLEFQLVCTGCPAPPESPRNAPWICDHCYYKHPDPVDDPFYQSTVKSLMYFCAAVLLFVRVVVIYIFHAKFRNPILVLSGWTMVLFAYSRESDLAKPSTTLAYFRASDT
jgi:hypothetical protein